MDYSGYLAALGTSVCYACGSVFFTLSGRKVSSIVVNRTRLVMALIIMMIIHVRQFGTLFPLAAEPERFVWLSLSGIVGLALGDFFLFQAFVLIGPRLTMLIFALSSVLSAILAFIFLGQVLTLTQILGILVTVGGIAIVVTESRDDEKAKGKPKTDDPEVAAEDAATPSTTDQPLTQAVFLRGLFFAFLAACGQAVGTILSKQGMAGGFVPVSANTIRMLAAVIAIWAVALITGQVGYTINQLRRNPRSILQMLIGTILGPVGGVLLGLHAIEHAPVGIAATLSSLMPIFLIPISFVAFGERITLRGVIATVIVVVGITMLV